MKFTELLAKWMDARDNYNAAKRSNQFDWTWLDELEGVMIAAERDLNDLFETKCNA